jgi:hypothetical protein
MLEICLQTHIVSAVEMLTRISSIEFASITSINEVREGVPPHLQVLIHQFLHRAPRCQMLQTSAVHWTLISEVV